MSPIRECILEVWIPPPASEHRGRSANRTSAMCFTGCACPCLNEAIDYLQLVSSLGQRPRPDCISLPSAEISGLPRPGQLMTIYHIPKLMNKPCHSILKCVFLLILILSSVGGAGQPSAEREEWPAVPNGGGSGGHEWADEETQSCSCPGNPTCLIPRWAVWQPRNYELLMLPMRPPKSNKKQCNSCSLRNCGVLSLLSSLTFRSSLHV